MKGVGASHSWGEECLLLPFCSMLPHTKLFLHILILRWKSHLIPQRLTPKIRVHRIEILLTQFLGRISSRQSGCICTESASEAFLSSENPVTFAPSRERWQDFSGPLWSSCITFHGQNHSDPFVLGCYTNVPFDSCSSCHYGWFSTCSCLKMWKGYLEKRGHPLTCSTLDLLDWSEES